VGANTTAYSDNGLSATTTYYYQVTAYNSAGSSAASNSANATTLAVGSGPEMHVENLVVSRAALNGNRFRGEATATIYDDLGAAVSGATVNVSFSGPSSGTRSGTTNGSGQVSFTTGGVKNPSGEWCFEVTNVTLSGATYNAASNIVTIACESGPQARIGNTQVAGMEPEASLMGVYPNPLQDETNVLFQLTESSEVSLEVYSMVGDLVTVIAQQEFDAGQHLFHWETKTLHGGSYILMFRVGDKVETKKLTIIR
jgi:hypothetical protein